MKTTGWTDRYSHTVMGLMAVIIFFIFFSPRLRFDAIRYVAPARSLLIDGDLNTWNEDSFYTRPGWNSVVRRQVKGFNRQFIQYESAPEYTDNGYKHVVFPIGNALTWLPSMTLTHIVMVITNGFFNSFPRDGFSIPYLFSLAWFSFALGVLAWLAAYRLLRLWYSPGIACWAVLFGVCAGNIIPFMTIDVAFSHSLDFFLVNSVLLLTMIVLASYGDEYETGELQGIHALLGLVAGWAVIVRYQDLALMLIPLMVYATSGLMRRKSSQFNWLQPLVFVLCAGAVIALQLLYWKILFGRFFISGELMGTGNLASFNLMKPAILEMFFSKHHGLFSWQPWLLPVFLSGFLVVRRSRVFGIALVLVILLEVYYNASRTEWWNLGFSVRRFSGWSIFFMIGTAELISLIRHNGLRSLMKLTGCLAIVWNWLFMLNYHLGFGSGSVLPELIGNLGPYGETQYGVIFPAGKEFVKSLTGAWQYISQYSWLWYVIQWMKSELIFLSLLVLISNLIFIIAIWKGIQKSYPVILEKLRIPVAVFTGYLVISAIVLGASHCSVQPRTLYFYSRGSNNVKTQNLSINPGQIFTGINSFHDIPENGIRLPIQSTERKILRVFAGSSVTPSDAEPHEILQLSLIQTSGKEVILKADHQRCRDVSRPWGDVPYFRKWFHLEYLLPLRVKDGDQLLIKPGKTVSDVVTSGVLL